MSSATQVPIRSHRLNFSMRYLWLVIVSLLVFFPLLLPTHMQEIMTEFLIYALFALSFDLVFGYTGLVSLGHAAFFGLGGYAVGVLSLQFANNLFWLAMPLGILLAVLVAFPFGFISLRVSGTYFLLLTFALAQLLYSVSWNMPWLNTPGIQGIAGIELPSLGLAGMEWGTGNFYYFVLVIFGICYYLLWRVVHSTFGHALVGIREGEARMQSLGYNTWAFKYIAYIIAAAFAAVAGVLFAYYNRFISPAQFSISTSFYPMVMVILGGSGTLYGAVVGAAIVVFVEFFASTATPERWPLILGSIFVVSIMFFRSGLGVGLAKLLQKVSNQNGNPTG